MKQAILITAYKNDGQVLDIINYFPSNFNFYIHVDKRSPIDLESLKNSRNKNVFVCNKYRVNWGGLNHLKAILSLSAEALQNKENSFFHLITGEDYPIKSVNHFESTLDQSKDYLIFFKMPAEVWYDEDGGFERIKYYSLYDAFDVKKTKDRGKIDFLIKLQKTLRIKRSYSARLPQLYGSNTYWSLTRATLQYLIDYTFTQKKLLRRMKFTACPEEIYVATVIVNSKRSDNIINDNLRYIDWQSEQRGLPAVLDSTDFVKILSSNSLFARKFDVEKSKQLKQLLVGHFNNQLSF